MFQAARSRPGRTGPGGCRPAPGIASDDALEASNTDNITGAFIRGAVACSVFEKAVEPKP